MTLLAVLTTSARRPALPEHLDPRDPSLGSQTFEPPSHREEAWNGYSQEPGSLGHSKALPLASLATDAAQLCH